MTTIIQAIILLLSTLFQAIILLLSTLQTSPCQRGEQELREHLSPVNTAALPGIPLPSARGIHTHQTYLQQPALPQETTGIPGAVNSRRRGRVYPHSRPRPRPNMVIPADNSRPHPRPRHRERCSVHGPGPGLGQILPPVVYCPACFRTVSILADGTLSMAIQPCNLHTTVN